MVKKIVVCSMVVALATASLYGCGGGGGSDDVTPTPTPTPTATPSGSPTPTPTPTPPGTQVISAATPTATATVDADVFQIAVPTGDYTATISNGFLYPTDKISIPVGSSKPTAVFGGVNNVIDGSVVLTWNSNNNTITITLTGLNNQTENALQSNVADVPAGTIFTTYTPAP